MIKIISLFLLIIILCTAETCFKENEPIKPLKVKAGFTFELKENGVVNFKNSSQNATKYDWSLDDGQISTDENPSITYRKNGNYSIKLVAFNQTSKDSVVAEVRVSNIVYANSDNIFVCDDSGNCTLANAKTGDIRWQLNFPQSNLASSPTYSNGAIFIGANFYPNGKLISLDIENGNTNWEFISKFGIRTCPIIQGNRIYFTSSNWSEGILYCLDSSNGKLIWETLLPFVRDSSPTINNNKIILGSDIGLYFVDIETGKSSNSPIKSLRLHGVDGEESYLSSPCTNQNNIYHCLNGNFTDSKSTIIKYNIQNNNAIKLFELSPKTISSPTLSENSIVINNNEKLVCFDITTLKNNWIFNFPTTKSSSYPFSLDSSPIVSQNNVYAVGNGVLFSIDFESGRENWRYGSDLLTSPVYYDNTVYVSSINKLIAIDSNKGVLKWSLPIKNNNWSIEPSVIVINSKGKVFHSGISGEQQ
jgi:outer membrane protein assembly factor BamB